MADAISLVDRHVPALFQFQVYNMTTPVFHRAGLPESLETPVAGNHGSARTAGERATPEHRIELARAAERYGYDSILSIATHKNYDPFVATSFLAAHTSRIKFIVAVNPGFALPTFVAQQSATFQELSNNRLYLNIITGSWEDELRGYGERLDKLDRYARTDEFFDVLKLSFGSERFDYDGKFYNVEGGVPRNLDVTPTLFVGGSSDGGRAVGAKHADIHLSYGETPPLIAENVQRSRELADKAGRKLQFGMLISVIARETSAEAWRETDRILSGVDIEQAERQRQWTATRNSVGEARVQSVSAGTNLRDPASLRVYPNIWAGPHRTTLVGSYAEVAERIEEYLSVGVEHFIIGGRPALESICEFGEGVMPLFQKQRDGVSRAAA
jgi:alkanesulfonate monooxygenase